MPLSTSFFIWTSICLELGVLDLVGDAFDGGADADAGADHDRELAGEVLDVLGAGAEGELRLKSLPFLRRIVGGREREDVLAAAAELLPTPPPGSRR